MTQSHVEGSTEEVPPRTSIPAMESSANKSLRPRTSLPSSVSSLLRSPSPRRPINGGNVRQDQPHNICRCGSPNLPEQLSKNEQANISSMKGAKYRAPGWKGLEKAMRALHISSRSLPQIHAAIGDLVSCLEPFKVAQNNREEYNELVSELSTMAEYVKLHLKDRRSQALTERISDIAETIEREIEEVRQLQCQSKTVQVFRGEDREEDLVRRFRRIGELFRRIQTEMSMSEWSKTNEALTNTRLEKLKPSMLALYNSKISDAIGRRACTDETRIDVLASIYKWCDDPNAPAIYWLNGMAGTGKTTIAYTLANKLKSLGRLGASFFCTVTSEECRDASNIIPTIAYQLAHQSTPFQAAIGEVLKQEPGVATAMISEQLKRLLLEPLGSIKGKLARNLVVVVDALDECRNDNVVGLLLGSLIRSTNQLPVKFFVASRPDPAIHTYLHSQPDDLRSVLHLHEVSETNVQHDIRLYLQEGMKSLEPTEDEVEQLTRLSGRLFIYAATAVRYIAPDNPLVDSRARLQTMLDMRSKSTKKQSGIDALYSAILSAAVNNDELEPDERDNILSVVWTVVCSARPHSYVGIVVDAGLNDESAALAALAPLRSVLHVSHTEQTVATFHASFPQFILDQSRSQGFSCDRPFIIHERTVRRWKVINAQLDNFIQPHTAVSPHLVFTLQNILTLEIMRSFFNDTSEDGAYGSEELYTELRIFYGIRFERCLWLMANLEEVRNKRKNWYKLVWTYVSAWVERIKAPADLQRAARNARVYAHCNEADRQLIRDTTVRNHPDMPNESTESYSRGSWIWGEIDPEVQARTRAHQIEVFSGA